ncbi:hypothetical protein [Telmatospirillum sp.]|uniref:hypothetical protein n=1 Tax=Telmatospirillum sp. TaxID=2079197 RepID=UPI00284C47C1|nr:hypothetical protein [Telmatospirillum sp.]MDR3438939.1 hypothetical protein [Telmatospirillum sp.]
MPKLSDFVVTSGRSTSGGVPGASIPSGTIITPQPTSNDNISAGDIVTLSNDNNAYWATDPNNTYATQIRPIFNALTQNWPTFKAPASVLGGLAAFGSDCSDWCRLTNGNIVVVNSSGSQQASAGNFFNFTILDTYGNVVQAKQTVNIGGYCNYAYVPTVCALPNGGFCISGASSQDGSYVTPWAAFFTTSTTTPTVVQLDPQQVVSGSMIRVNCVGLSNGYVAFSWCAYSVTSSAGTAKGPGCKSSIWNPNTATVVVNTFAVNASTTALTEGYSGYRALSFAGGYAVPYSPAAGSVYYVCLFDNTGTQIGVITCNAPTSMPNILGATLQNGNLAFVAAPSNSASISYVIVATNGSAVQPAKTLALATGQGGNSQFTLSGGQGAFGGFFIGASDTSGKIGYAVIDQTGSVLANTYIGTSGVSSNFSPNGIMATQDGGAILGGLSVLGSAYKIAPTTYAYSVSASVTYGGSYHLKLIPLIPNWGTSHPLSCPFIAICDSYVMVGAAQVPQAVPVGVASAAAAAGTNVQIATSGQVYTRLTLVQTTYNCDARSNNPPGQQMSIVGNVATLNGFQRSSPRSIN